MKLAAQNGSTRMRKLTFAEDIAGEGPITAGEAWTVPYGGKDVDQSGLNEVPTP